MGPAATIHGFYRAVESGEVTAASEMISESTLSMLAPKKLQRILQSETEKISRNKGIESIETLSEDIDGREAEVHVRLTYGNGETEEQRITLTWVDGSWKISPKGKGPDL